MDFFQSQDAARKHTGLLILLFVLAVVSLIVLTNMLVMVAFGFIQTGTEPGSSGIDLAQFDWKTFAQISAGVVLVITFGSLYKMALLSGGGASVAEMMNAKLIADGGGDLNQQKVLNVVEEMAIASGTPVPPVYLLEEEGINAFAAGFTPSDAVIGVTRGAIEKLSRAQLQGVMAHEFSHIINGDMRLNIRLIGVLNGILLLGMIGYFLLRSSFYTARPMRRSSRDDNGGAILALGIGLVVIGYAGTFFGNLIKAAVSRQREFLADASAVQFTRNPSGIAGALKRIGLDSTGARLDNPHAAEISHALFGQGVSGFLGGLLATHPPLEERIRRIDPTWDGDYGNQPIAAGTGDAANGRDNGARSDTFARTAAIAAAGAGLNAIDQIGQPEQRHLDYAQELILGLPEVLLQTVREPHGARAVVYFLVLNRDLDTRAKQLQHLATAADDGVYEATLKIADGVSDLDIKYRLPLLDMALPALRRLSARQYQLFKENTNALIEIDDRIELFEWSLRKIVFHHLDAVFVKQPAAQRKYRSLQQVKDACAVLLSVLVHSGKQEGIGDDEVFAAARDNLDHLDISLMARNELSLAALNTALDELNRLRPLLKPQLLKACATCITADQRITPVEAELFRVVAYALDCPMPPLVIQP